MLLMMQNRLQQVWHRVLRCDTPTEQSMTDGGAAEGDRFDMYMS